MAPEVCSGTDPGEDPRSYPVDVVLLPTRPAKSLKIHSFCECERHCQGRRGSYLTGVRWRGHAPSDSAPQGRGGSQASTQDGQQAGCNGSSSVGWEPRKQRPLHAFNRTLCAVENRELCLPASMPDWQGLSSVNSRERCLARSSVG